MLADPASQERHGATVGAMDPGDARLDPLVRDCWPALLRTGYLMTGEPAAARGLVEDALRRRLGEARGAADPAAALRIAVVREAFRHRKLYSSGSAPFGEAWGGPEAEPVLRALRGLPLDERAVLVMRFCEGLEPAQVVDLLSVPRGIVTERERRGLKGLRAQGLVPQDGEPQPQQVRQLLDAVAAPLPVPGAPDLQVLLESSGRSRGRRMVLIGATAAAVGAVVVARWL